MQLWFATPEHAARHAGAPMSVCTSSTYKVYSDGSALVDSASEFRCFQTTCEVLASARVAERGERVGVGRRVGRGISYVSICKVGGERSSCRGAYRPKDGTCTVSVRLWSTSVWCRGVTSVMRNRVEESRSYYLKCGRFAQDAGELGDTWCHGCWKDAACFTLKVGDLP